MIISFDDFWFYYPRKTAKPKARSAWNKLDPSPAIKDKILENLKARAEAGEWKDKQFIPHPSTYLNGERWDDEIIKPTNGRTELVEDLTDRGWANQPDPYAPR